MPAEAMAPAETATAGWGFGGIGVRPDGNLYASVQGLAEDEVTQMMGIGYLGEVRQARTKSLPVDAGCGRPGQSRGLLGETA